MRKLSTQKKLVSLIGISLASVAALSGCNVFSLIDKPSGDVQILSAARACFDSGDFECARGYYAQLSSEFNDIKASEEAFLILAENGATMAAFMETFGSGGSGAALTDLAERMAPGSATKRVNIQNAFKKYNDITGNPSLKALVRFVGAVALAAEFLAEEIPAEGGQLTKAMITLNGGSCSLDNTTCATDTTDCGVPAGAKITNAITGQTFNFLTTSLASVTLDLGHFKNIMNEMNLALSDLSASGGFGSGSGGMSSSITSENLTNDPAVYSCFRSNMLALGIGR